MMTEEKPYWVVDWDAQQRELSDIDREALERALAMALADKDQGRVEQVRHMLETDHWLEVRGFCAYGQQRRSLGLRPWESPPMYGETEARDGFRNDAARKLLKKMLAAGLSRYEPDPVTALRAKGKR